MQNHYKLISLLVTKVLEQPACETLVHNVVMIRDGRHANAKADLNVSPPIGTYKKQLECWVSSKATALVNFSVNI